MIDRLNECYRIAYAALEEGPPWTKAEEMAIKWQPAIEDYADTLSGGTDREQLEIFRYRKDLDELCKKILP